MIRTFLKLAVVVLIGYALYHVGDAYWDHYQFEDSVQQMAQFSEHLSADEIRDKVMQLAVSNDIPLAQDDLTVTHQNHKIEINGSYTRDIQVLPTYVRHWDFTVHVVVLTLS
jgi:hypothetical protein